MEFTGRIYKVLDTASGKKQDGSEWKRQDFIFEYFENPNDRYSDKVVLSVMNDRIAEYDLHEGDEVRIGFGHSVREWQGRWFSEMRIYKFEKVSAKAAVSPQQTVQAQPVQTTLEMVAAPDTIKNDNLPF